MQASKSKTLVYKRRHKKDGWKLLGMAIPFLLFVTAFSYVPLFGWAYAFVEYKPGIPIFVSEFVGLKNFMYIFTTGANELSRIMQNTLVLSGLGLLISPLPAFFAILLNEIRGSSFKRLVQTATTLPNFISWIIAYSLTFAIFSTDGMIANLFSLFGGEFAPGSINPLGNGNIVWVFQTVLGVWKSLGWSAIIYIAAISGIDNELYEAAKVDGANRFQQTLHVTLPGLYTTFFVLLLLSISNILSNGFDQYFVFHNALVARRIEVLDYYTYKVGILSNKYSVSTAIGMFKTLFSVTLLFGANWMSKKIRGESIM